ncbi:hypothetical protein ACQ33O_12160 [Ferruginibacter sp. SUN002]|uniref:tetratricopeptide repeat protein n=1 Tax=Ferruginibacter sp. SUN002 TaxID=2937789 RepID=UPI003D36A782
MKSKIFFACVIASLILIAGFRYSSKHKPSAPQTISRESIFKNKMIMQCSPDWSDIDEDSLANGIGRLPGWGNYRWNISTKNDSAQFYFNQGINMYYAFHIIESMASFKKAERFDNNNAMIYWAQALAYGPNINDFAYAATPEAFTAAQKALSLKSNCTPKEKVLIEAMAVRYSADSTVSRASLNQQYADAMKAAYKLFNQDADIAALYADALMLQHPWDYWQHDGEPRPWTPEILSVLENILKTHPIHPGANHYYIHSIEASPKPQKAIASADRLGKLMPGVAHMVHMPSHIYIRSGNYKQGIKVNEMAVKGYANYSKLFPDIQNPNSIMLYLIHNLHMQSSCAMMRSNYRYSNKSSIECQQSFDTSFMSLPAPFGNYIQYLYMTPAINYVRFGKWNELLAIPSPAEHHIYAKVLWHWARGMAFARIDNTDGAKSELVAMKEEMKAADMQIVLEPFNAPVSAAEVAEKILSGIIAQQENNYTAAIKLLNEAVTKEDALIYTEPRDWLLPTRQYLGDVLLKSGATAKAEKIFKEDLKENPNNHWSLYGLYQSLIKQKKNAEAIIIKKQFDKAFEGNDISIGHIVF